MNTVVLTQDGALGYTASDGPVYVVGPASQGSTSQVQSFGDPSALYNVYGGGKLPDRSAFHFSVGGGGPVAALRMATANAGSIPAYAASFADALAGNDASNAFANLAFVGGTNVEAVFAANYDGGNITLTGTASDKVTAQTETITASAGNTVKGVKVFGTLTAAAKGAQGANAATCTLKNGNKTAAGASTDSKLVLSGTPVDDQDVLVKMTRDGGTAAAPYAAYQTSFDGGDTFGPETAVPNGGSLALGQGLTATLSGSAVKAGDVFRQRVLGPTASTQNLTDALAVLSGLNVDGGELHILGGVTGAQAAAVVSWRGTERTAGRDWQIYLEARDFNAGETKAQYIAALQSDVAALLDTEGGVTWTPGWWETVLPGGRGIQRRSFAWAAVSQIWRLPFWVHPSCQEDGGGALPGLYTTLEPTAPNTHDERISPGLGGSAGRFMTVQSQPGSDNQGKWFVGDFTGDRSPGTLAAGTSDFSLLMNARVANRCRRAMQAYSAKILAARYPSTASGVLTDAARLDLNTKAAASLKRVLGGAVQGVRVEFSATEPYRTSKRLPYTVYLNTWSYALEIRATVALEPVRN